MFALLSDRIRGQVVDLYAGTGALGIEALSHGASHAVFVENNRAALICLRQNLDQLGVADRSSVLALPVERCWTRLLALCPFALAFCDPPWAILEQTARWLVKTPPTNWLGTDGLLVLEHPRQWEIPQMLRAHFDPVDRRNWGDTAVTCLAPRSTASIDVAACVNENHLPE